MQSKPDKFKCLGTPKLLELIRSAVYVQTYTYSTMELNLSEEREPSCRISSNLSLFTNRIVLTTPAPNHPTHTHMYTRAHASRCQWVWMISDEVNKVTAKKSVIFEEKKGGKN